MEAIDWSHRLAVVYINIVMPYLKKNRLKISKTKLTPELMVRCVKIINWGEK